MVELLSGWSGLLLPPKLSVVPGTPASAAGRLRTASGTAAAAAHKFGWGRRRRTAVAAPAEVVLVPVGQWRQWQFGPGTVDTAVGTVAALLTVVGWLAVELSAVHTELVLVVHMPVGSPVVRSHLSVVLLVGHKWVLPLLLAVHTVVAGHMLAVLRMPGRLAWRLGLGLRTGLRVAERQ